MAIKKNYKAGTKYNYAVINQLVYNKESSILANVLLREKDRAWKPKIQDEIPTGKTDKDGNPIMEKIMETEEEPERITEMNFTIPLMDVETRKPNKLFTLDQISKKDNNLIRSCYTWLKKNVDIFSGWKDC